jgi:hypothetical protein
MVTARKRGHLISYIGGIWVYVSDNKPIGQEERPCVRCGRLPTPEGYDACLGYVEGATSACCGHGVENAYIVRNQDS